MHPLVRSRVAVLIVLASTARLAHAQPTAGDSLGKQLFQEGRALAKAGRYAEACPKFEASLRDDAAPGTRLGLADCYENIGRLASAWELYREVVDLAQKTDDDARRTFASERMAALGPRLPRLTIEVVSTVGATDFAITRDGVTVDPRLYGLAIFVDPGAHEVVAIAMGFEPQTLRVDVSEGESATVRVPSLTRTEALTLPEPERGVMVVDTTQRHRQRVAGVAIGGAGLVTGAIGIATSSDGAKVFGAALVGMGVLAWVVTPDAKRRLVGGSEPVRVAPLVGSDALGGVVYGRF